MVEEIYKELIKLTDEEKRILEEHKGIEEDIYMSGTKTEIDKKKLLEAGKLIQVRKHPRFIYFPKHTHNYIEMIYMYSGSTRHIIDGIEIKLNQGEILFLSQNAVQEIQPAGMEDLAINFIIVPEFFDQTLHMMNEEENMLRTFVVESLRGEKATTSFLHFMVGDILPIQNLMENLIWTIMNRQSNKRNINQVTMGLLFLQLMNYMDRVKMNKNDQDNQFILDVLNYIENHYRNPKLDELSKDMHYSIYWLSKEIKKKTGKTYIELVQEKRLSQAAYLLQTTKFSVLEIGTLVGYDNQSYFHRIFQKKYGMTPRLFRIRTKEI